MPTFLLRNCATSRAYPNCFDVILTMDDGYELRVGGLSEATARSTDTFWTWSCPGGNGRAETKDAAKAALKAAWSATGEQLAQMRHQQEWTENKYALWNAGYAGKLGKGPIRCPCGEMFNPGIHAETQVHIRHITRRNS
jgi:hypothetical protein